MATTHPNIDLPATYPAARTTHEAVGRLFAPEAETAALVLAHVDRGDAAHDVGHLVRVWRGALAIVREDGLDVDTRSLAAAAVLHDCVHVEKDDPARVTASLLAARRASGVLLALGWARDAVDDVAHAVEAHSFSAGVEPLTDLACVLQDADRLDALGAVGIARCFMVSGRLGRPLYDVHDPRAERRPLDDLAYTLDHFPVKLLRLAGSFRTASGRREAERRTRDMRGFLDLLARETSDDAEGSYDPILPPLTGR